MYLLTKETSKLAEIAACIASDNFALLNRKISKYNKLFYKSIKLYELILQSYLFCGFPAAVESLNVFRKHYGDLNIHKSGYNIDKFKSSGIRNCKLIYKKNYKKLIENMNFLSTDLKEWMLIEGYGKVLGRKELSLTDREIISVSFLCTRYFESQLHSHLQGCLNLNIQKQTLKEILNSLRSISGNNNINRAIKLLNKIA